MNTTQYLRGSWVAASAVLCVIGGGILRAQARGQAKPLRTTTHVVNLNVVATDKLGNPVKDLKKEDFIIFDDGQPQQTAFFSALESGPPAASSELDSDTYTNRGADSGTASNVTILLFDMEHTDWIEQGYGLYCVRKFLRHIQPEDRIGIYVLGHDLTVVHDFATDSADLVAAIHRYDDKHARRERPHEAAGAQGSGEQIVDRFISGKRLWSRFERDEQGKETKFTRATLEWRQRVTAKSLEAIARQLSAVPGRKSLIWMTRGIGPMGLLLDDDLGQSMSEWQSQSSGLTLDSKAWEGNSAEERMARLMNDAGIAVYPVNVAGVGTEDPALNGGSRLGFGRFDLIGLAARTGGRAFYNRNDLETHIRRALDDSRFSYSLAYYPNHNQWRGEWRKLRVQITRPGVTALARGGYFALPDPAPLPSQNRLPFFTEIALSPVESKQLALSVHFSKPKDPGAAELAVTVHLEQVRLLNSGQDGHWEGSLEVMFMQLDGSNRFLDATSEQVRQDLQPGEYPAITENGWDLPVRLKRMPGATLLCVIVYDSKSSEVGSVRIPLAADSSR